MTDLANAKPCPFAACGVPHEDSPDLALCMNEDETECWVMCEDCLADGPVATFGCRDPDYQAVDIESEAIELWDNRAAESDQFRAGALWALDQVLANCRAADGSLKHPVDIRVELRRRIEAGEFPKAGG